MLWCIKSRSGEVFPALHVYDKPITAWRYAELYFKGGLKWIDGIFPEKAHQTILGAVGCNMHIFIRLNHI